MNATKPTRLKPLWTKITLSDGCDRHLLWMGEDRTPFFVDVAHTIGHRTSGAKYGVFGSGMHPKGIALELGSFDKISEAKRFALKSAYRRAARARHSARNRQGSTLATALAMIGA